MNDTIFNKSELETITETMERFEPLATEYLKKIGQYGNFEKGCGFEKTPDQYKDGVFYKDEGINEMFFTFVLFEATRLLAELHDMVHPEPTKVTRVIVIRNTDGKIETRNADDDGGYNSFLGEFETPEQAEEFLRGLEEAGVFDHEN